MEGKLARTGSTTSLPYQNTANYEVVYVYAVFADKVHVHLEAKTSYSNHPCEQDETTTAVNRCSRYNLQMPHNWL